jgi:signal transduction histidine kinase
MAFGLRRLPRVRTLLLATYLAVLLLPVGGIAFLRLYESALIRQTESELLAQAAVLSAAYRAAWLERASSAELAAMPRARLDWGVAPTPYSAERWRLLQAQLDLADSPILPRAPDAVPAGKPADPIALAVARTLAGVLANVREMTLAGIRIVDAQGIVVGATSDADLGLSMIGQEEVAQALEGAPAAVLRERAAVNGNPSWESISRTSQLRVFVAVPVVADGHVLGAVLVSRTPRNIIQTLYNKRYALLTLAVVLVVSVAVLAWFAGATVVRPTHQLAAMAQRVAAGDVRAVEPLASPMTREAQSLSDSIVAMARTLQARADYVRELALGVSHELKTPLTGIRGSTELLRDHLEEMSTDDRRKFLSNILDDTARLERLVRRILELGRADALTPRGDEACDVAEVATAMAEIWRGKGLKVSVEGPSSPLPAAIDRESLDIVLSNLLDNALQHGGAATSVRCVFRHEPESVVVDVLDDGPGISAGNADRVFDRFFTTARETGGTGLGLAIARRRVAAFGGDIALLPAKHGAAFRIRLKAS